MTQADAPRPVPERPAESGFTLIELLVYCALLVLVLTIVGGLLITGLKVGGNVRSVSEATTEAQLISTSVQAAVRNASAVTEIDQGTDGSQLVIARTSTKGASQGWMCQAWFYSAADKAIYTTTTNPAAAIVVPTGGPRNHWTLLGEGIGPADPTSTGPFHVTTYSVSLDFHVEASGGNPISIHTSAYTRTDLPESAPCF